MGKFSSAYKCSQDGENERKIEDTHGLREVRQIKKDTSGINAKKTNKIRVT